MSLAALLMLSLNACTQTYGRSQLMLLTPEQERQIGESGRDEILQQSKLSTNKNAIAQVTRVGQKIAKAANQPDFDWEFYVIEDKTVNAFCLPTGKVFVYTGILPFVSSDDELATIM
ncbi:MAG: M48 family metalloprotease, partial [Helicobacter sp.]|nr:M48 family metalloprotease [Helicobacter sp.]